MREQSHRNTAWQARLLFWKPGTEEACFPWGHEVDEGVPSQVPVVTISPSGHFSLGVKIFFVKDVKTGHTSWLGNLVLASCPKGVLRNAGFMDPAGSRVGTCNDFQAMWEGRKKRSASLLPGSRDILFTNTRCLESLVSHHHLYSWGIDVSLTLQQCFVTFGFTMFKLKSLAPCSLSKTASLSIYFCLPHPVWISFVNLYLTTLVFQ